MYQKSPVGKVVIDEIANFIIESYPNKESGIVYCFESATSVKFNVIASGGRANRSTNVVRSLISSKSLERVDEPNVISKTSILLMNNAP